jgi:DNA-binding response OmpR family regulator
MLAAFEDIPSQPCLVLAHPDPAFAALASRSFRRLGWDVYLARTGPEARRLARMLQAHLVILDADLPEESGWLTCDKLTRELPHVKVLLTKSEPTLQDERLAAFVGASALINRHDGTTALLRQASDMAVSLRA